MATDECRHYEHYVSAQDRYVCPKHTCPECGMPVDMEGAFCGECLEKVG